MVCCFVLQPLCRLWNGHLASLFAWEKQFFPFLSSWLPNSRRVTQGSHMISFNLSVLRPFRNGTRTPNLKFIGLYICSNWTCDFLFFSGNITDRSLVPLHWGELIHNACYLPGTCARHSLNWDETNFCPLGVFSLAGNKYKQIAIFLNVTVYVSIKYWKGD